jgi:hypothetical protein
VFDLTDLDLDGVDTVNDDLSLANLRTVAGLHLRNAKAGARSCSGCGCLCCCECHCNYGPEPTNKK